MPITSTGYDSSVDETAWGARAHMLGSDPGVAGQDDFYVFLATLENTVTVRAGSAYGRGVVDVLDTDTDLTVTRPLTGERHDVVVLRRDWTTNTTSLAVVSGGSARQVPPLAHTDTLDEQALALVLVPAEGTLVISDDLRVTWSTSALTDTKTGMEGQLGTRWIDNAGHRWETTIEGVQREWEPAPAPVPEIPTVVTGSSPIAFNTDGSASVPHGLGWRPDVVAFTSRATDQSGMVQVFLSLQPGSINEQAFTVVGKVRTKDGKGWLPYTGKLTSVDWLAHRRTPPPNLLPGQVAAPDPEPVTPEVESAPITSGAGADLVLIDTGAAPAPQIPIPDTPPIYKVTSPVTSSVDTILATAAREIGTRESPAGSNKVKYWLDERPSWNGSAWCAAFACWVYRRNGISVNTVLSPNLRDNNPYYTPYLEAAAKAKGLWYTTTPRPGDMVIYGGSANTHAVHVEIVEKFIPSTGRVQCIGGNTSDGLNGSPSNGGGVWRNIRNPKSSSLPIRGYIRMPTAVPVNLQATGPFPLPTGHWFGVADSSTTMDHNGVADNKQGVMQVQAEVGATIDGVFGPATETLVKAWQKAMFRTQHGRIYKEDWDVLRGSFSVPPRPTGIVATALDKAARVVFNTSSGAQQYTAVASTGQSVTGTSSPLTITGLTPGVGVTITVVATNVAGKSDTSARSNMVWPGEGGRTTIPTTDGSVFVVWSGSSTIGELINAVTLDNKDATTYAALTGKLPAAQWTAAIRQAARNVAAILYGTQYKPPAARNATIRFTAENEVAYAWNDTGEIVYGTKARTAANLASFTTHEVCHLVQQRARTFTNDTQARGIIEGIADYVLVVMGYHPFSFRPADGGANWWDGYDTTAFFLYYVAHQAPTKSGDFVRRLNQQMSSASWTPAQITSINARGMTVEALWAEYKAWIAAGN